MKIINSIKQLTSLNLPKGIHQQALHHLTEPCDHNIDATELMWQDVKAKLFLLEPTDTDESLEHSEDWQWLELVMQQPEFIIKLSAENEPAYLLALAIVSDDGQGCYVLADMKHTSMLVTELSKEIN